MNIISASLFFFTIHIIRTYLQTNKYSLACYCTDKKPQHIPISYTITSRYSFFVSTHYILWLKARMCNKLNARKKTRFVWWLWVGSRNTIFLCELMCLLWSPNWDVSNLLAVIIYNVYVVIGDTFWTSS